ncbi:uncharacterized protein KGF55_003302 [Candida pseudojiufengensis]|uniref:uncharacterized protein n=1 Tax=Candida pseudojiufengensis TaxID=497109 RepID=UPI00222471CD|nr:uncharacterized protein KGF55_003302 [Candida pseudojiufengensis]KAI5962226.1 hypothetical protein KGF55_003302 [Candida pseudojiufengensis]
MSDLLSNPADTLSYLDISFLTFEAVLEVIIICFAGFIAAKTGLLNTKGQKILSSLNVDLFTPCLIFSKLASSLSLSKLIDIIIIPIFFTVSTLISFLCSKLTSLFLGLNEPETDFVTAMAVFGNSNSLPVSLTLSLAYTLPGLLWDDIPDDDSDKVAGRGILYLLIFQQLGQILRWSWGFNTLLRKRSQLELNTYYSKNGVKIINDEQFHLLAEDNEQALYIDEERVTSNEINATSTSSSSSSSSSNNSISNNYTSNNTPSQTYNSQLHSQSHDPSPISDSDDSDNNNNTNNTNNDNKVEILEKPIRFLDFLKNLPGIKQFISFMNPPLHAMLLSVIVASTPLQKIFFKIGKENGDGSFVHNTLTEAITNLGSVSIPLILIVLGSNLYPSLDIPAPSKHYNRILFGSLLSRMILPSLILLPIIAGCVKYINISILDDPIFLIVSFILTISPPAIQLSQISQLNGIYQKEMSGVLFWGYVVLTLPTTIFIVVCSLEVLKWAQK